jgi:hypothetical protein
MAEVLEVKIMLCSVSVPEFMKLEVYNFLAKFLVLLAHKKTGAHAGFFANCSKRLISR